MFDKIMKVSDERIIKVVADALQSGGFNGKVESYLSLKEIVLWDLNRLLEADKFKSNTDEKLNALLDYLGLEFISSPKGIIRKKKK